MSETRTMGFMAWNTTRSIGRPILDSLHAYKELHGDLEVLISVRSVVR